MNKTTCRECKKEFYYNVTDMHDLGGKGRENIVCPYCKEINGSVVTSGLVYSYKIEDIKTN